LKTSPSPALHAVFLGTSDGTTSVNREHSGVLLEGGGESILLDCGGNAARHFRAGEFSADVPGAIWLSHMHSDHIGQFGMLIQSLWLRQRRAPLRVFGPAQVVRVMQEWLVRCILFPGLIGFEIEWHAVVPGQPVQRGPFTLTAFATEHLAGLASQFRKDFPDTCYECYGVAIEFEGRRYVYSADLAHPRELAPALAPGEVNALICELAHFPERELFRALAPYDISSLWIVHYPDTLVGQEKRLQSVAQEEKFRGNVHLLQDKVAVDI
jgi:ribonuclease BN (tRNA processing enzyme)